ncbi:OX-2 membrane glycoprotein isoform X4 [Alligator mississippiensis]|uniref:OX-2 membrane glycoprotein isoform X4 n=1 Tax=Alligator mississippiensis TaxID=8496 RepID=UPI000907049C|nr:OX-2 membrane glycoprotein isoform X4 [Alligator mississippiensis]XP_059576500.1 OX-2 membrane glycoprotein isoform X4 [Alligator mississippiensis]
MGSQVNAQFDSHKTLQALVWYAAVTLLCRAHVDIETKKNQKAEVGSNATLRCVLRKPHDIVQVTWQKKTSPFPENVATYQKNSSKVQNPYRGRLDITGTSLDDTAITFWGVRIQDNGCYKCLFNTFPAGSFGKETCLTVYEPLRISVSYSLSEGHLMANCSASAWPRPTITWLGLENQNKKTEEKVSDLNGTVLVTSHLYINNSESLVGHNLTCRASSMDEDKTSSVKVEGRWSHSVPVAVSVVCVVILLVMTVILLVVCWKRHKTKQSEGRIRDHRRGGIETKRCQSGEISTLHQPKIAARGNKDLNCLCPC